MHNAFGTNYNWDWFRGLLGGAQLYDHAAEQTGTVDVLDPRRRLDQGAAEDVDRRGRVVQPGARARKACGSSRRSTRARSTQGQQGYYGDPGMGAFHPVTWCQYYDGGKAWLTTLGHDAGDW